MIAYALPFIEETHKPLFCEFAVRTQQEEEEGGGGGKKKLLYYKSSLLCKLENIK
jgi:hypothetical protein